MKRRGAYLIFLAATLFAAGLLYGEVVDKVAIIVNDEIVTDSEISMSLRPVYEKFKTVYSGNKLIEKLEEAKQRITEQIIEDRLILSEAKKLNIEVDEKEVEAKVAEMRKRVGDSFDEALKAQRLTLKDLKTKYREQLMVRKLVDQKVGSRITITPVEVNNYYQNNTAEFTQPEEVKLWNILINSKREGDPKKALDLARSISDRIKEGCDFAGLAKTYSNGPNAEDGGLMGYVKKGYLLPEIDKVIFNMKAGEVSGMVQTSLGYHIFKVEEKKPGRTLSISEAERDIEDAIFREKVKAKLKGWIEGLKKNAYIAFK